MYLGAKLRLFLFVRTPAWPSDRLFSPGITVILCNILFFDSTRSLLLELRSHEKKMPAPVRALSWRLRFVLSLQMFLFVSGNCCPDGNSFVRKLQDALPFPFLCVCLHPLSVDFCSVVAIDDTFLMKTIFVRLSSGNLLRV